MNPNKRILGVSSLRFLGYHVSEKGQQRTTKVQTTAHEETTAYLPWNGAILLSLRRILGRASKPAVCSYEDWTF